MKSKITMTTVDGRLIEVDTSDEVCLNFGFKSGEKLKDPNGFEVTMAGVAPDNDGHDAPWYEINHPRMKGKICYWGGERNLVEAGFVKQSA